MTPQENNSKIRRGLVLEGGGAKGAWQFGALQALDKAGIKFDYVAGTSVGALNGGLWATGRLDLGKELWGSLSSSKVFKPRIHHSPMFLIGLFARTFYAYVNGFISPNAAPRSLRIILYGLISAPSIVASIYLLLMLVHLFWAAATAGKPWWLIPLGVVIVAFLLAGLVLDRKEEGHKQYFFYTSYLASLVLLAQLIIYVAGVIDNYRGRGIGNNSQEGPALGRLIVYTALEMPIFLWVLGVTPFVIFCIARLLRELNTSLFSVAPLEVIIKDLLAGGFKIPMFATVAREIHEYFDPDDFQYRRKTEPKLSEAIPRCTILPIYLRVDSLSPDDALTTLLATSALPLGITPRRKGKYAVNPQELSAVLEAEAKEFSKLLLSQTLGKRYQGSEVFLIDGGVVDNIPWYPFIEDVPCDEIVIVGCNPVSKWDCSERKREWKLKNRFLRVVNWSLHYDDRHDRVFDEESSRFPKAKFIVDKDGIVRANEQDKLATFARVRTGHAENVKNDPPVEIPFREPAFWPKRVVTISPDTPLGNFLTGTLNFSTKVAQKRMAAGYEKASRVIEKEFHRHGEPL